MGKVQLLFEGHLSEAIGPFCFKILEPFPVDGDTWAENNFGSGKALATLDGKAIAFTTSDVGMNYLVDNKEKLNIDWDKAYCTGSFPNNLIGGLYAI